MGMHREYALICDECGEMSETCMFAEDAKWAAERDGWKVSWSSNDATCDECLNLTD